MKTKRALATVLGSLFLFGATACSDAEKQGILTGSNDSPSLVKSGHELAFYCSDKAMQEFLNDYYSRNVRNGADAIGTMLLGSGSTYQKIWETDSLVWFDSTAEGLGTYDGMNCLKAFLHNVTIDKMGNVYSLDNPPVITTEERTAWQGMGWPFPCYNAPASVGIHSYGANFLNGAAGWKVDGEDGVAEKGCLTFSFEGKRNERLILEVDTLNEEGRGYDTTLFGNFLEVDLRLEDLNAKAGVNSSVIEDYHIAWQTDEGGDEWFSVSQKAWSLTPKEMTSYQILRSFFPLYLHENWDGKHVKKIRVEIEPKEGENLNLNGKMNYLHMLSDTRQSINAANYLYALDQYVSYNNDVEFLAEQIDRARQAILFQLSALQGENGYLDLSYFRGHSLAMNDGRLSLDEASYGYLVGDGFWDVLPSGNRKAESDYYFYIALKSMANLERFFKAAGLEDDKQTTIADPYMREDQTIAYTHTAESLETLAEAVKTNICKDVEDGGFWNQETGRFVWAIYDADNPVTGAKKGEGMDYGHTELNLRMIYEGIATDEQARSILEWVSGERTVEGDTSTGEDIYFYEFAPRATTKRNESDYNFIWLKGQEKVDKKWKWGTNCQDGGAIMFVSFYDLMARDSVLGANDCYDRLKGIQKWYEKVQAAGGEGLRFYDKYYNRIAIDYFVSGEGAMEEYSLQSVTRGNGAVGLDTEFLESALTYAVIPYAFFGLQTSGYKELTIAPELPDKLDYFAMENLMYSGIRYDCYATDSCVVLSGLNKQADGEKVRIRLAEPKGNYKVKINGKTTGEYTVENGVITVTVPFAQVKVSVE